MFACVSIIYIGAILIVSDVRRIKLITLLNSYGDLVAFVQTHTALPAVGFLSLASVLLWHNFSSSENSCHASSNNKVS